MATVQPLLLLRTPINEIKGVKNKIKPTFVHPDY